MIPPRERRRSTPASIGPYKILEELGRGGQGVVYLGQDAGGERVAVKSVADDAESDSPAFERLRREGEFLAILNHPNIARVHAPLMQDGRLFMIMEYVEGQTLADRLRFGPLPYNDGLSICRQVALAIESAHRARVLHRDIKPANIRISPDGDVKVLDFGIAAHADPTSRASGPALTSQSADPNTIVGTYGYMSPEQMMGGEIDHRTDIWSFGCILFECLVGHPLFSGATRDDVFLRAACRDADLGRLPSGVHKRLRGVLKHCLVRHPAGRLGAMDEVLDAIDAILSRRLPAGKRAGAFTNLPRRPNTFVGREREIAQIASDLRFSGGVCIVGPGGCGKTRLALEAGSRLQREYRDGVWFVDLSDRAPMDSIAAAIREAIPAEALSPRAPKTAPGDSENEGLASLLEGAQLLLVLDQCDLLREPLVQLCAAIQERAVNVRFVMTSRERLDIPGHQDCTLSPLEVPAPGVDHLGADRLLAIGSVRLFVERARLVDRAYAPDDAQAAAIADLCRRLEGLPLAVELASARIGTLTPAEIAGRLDSVLRESWEIQPNGGERRPRHSTLDACIRWSFDLLTPQERHILTRLSVFKGGWTLEAAEAICIGGQPDIRAQDVRLLLTRLVNKSLISYDAQSGRYSMLESVKAFAGTVLSPEERDVFRVRHFQFFTDLALKAEAQILGSEQTCGLRRVQSDLDNFGAALDATDLQAIPPEHFLKLARALNRFWYIRAHFQEGKRRLQEALDRAPDAEPLLRSQAHHAIGNLVFGLDDYAAAEAAYRDSLAIIQPTGTKTQMASVWENIAIACGGQGRNKEAESANASALELLREAGDLAGAARCKLNFVYHLIRQRQYDRAEQLCIECIDILRSSKDRKREAVALHNLGEIAYFRGCYAEAHRFFLESIRIKDELGDRRGVSLTVYMYALVLLHEGSMEHATELFAKSMEIRAELGISSFPMPQSEHDAAIERLSSALGPDRFSAHWNRGRELFDEEAVHTIAVTSAPDHH